MVFFMAFLKIYNFLTKNIIAIFTFWLDWSWQPFEFANFNFGHPVAV